MQWNGKEAEVDEGRRTPWGITSESVTLGVGAHHNKTTGLGTALRLIVLKLPVLLVDPIRVHVGFCK